MNEEPDDQSQPQAEPRTKATRGRPRKWTGDRRIGKVYEGRMSFKPGDPHPMDTQIEEARSLREAIVAQIAVLQGLVVELEQLDDPGVAISREEQGIKTLLWMLYGSRKHREHIIATFIAARRRRLLQRLQAAEAALVQAHSFLTADSTLLPLLQTMIAEAQAQAIALHGPPPAPPEAAQADEEQEGEQTESAVPTRQEEEDQEKRRALVQSAGGGDDAAATRAALADFEARVRVMRNGIAEGRGSFEWYYIPRPKQRTPEAAEYVARDEPIPPGVQEYKEEIRPPWGPYLRYRWWEGAHRYSIGMGHIKGGDPGRPDEPPAL